MTCCRGGDRSRKREAPKGDDSGFGLIEVLVASLILMVTVVGLAGLLSNSFTAALLSKERDTAASIASDTIENAKALGSSSLVAASPTCPTSVTSPTYSAVPALAASAFSTPYQVTIDRMSYVVCSSVTTSATTPDVVTVTVRYGSASTYTTTGQVGT